ncbi:MAG: transmembrane sensor [Arcticibacterium sp.]|jgi:transmembrane sensor
MKRAIDDYILAKYFDESANTKELAQVSEWLEEDPENQTLLKSYQKIWTASNKKVKDFQPDVDAAWKKINGKILVKNKKPNYLRIAAGLAGLLLLSTYVFIKNNQPIAYLSLKSEKASQVKTLADGSSVTLNSFSLLEYPETFGKDERRIKLIGEAFFDISKKPDKPFIIEANGTEIRVLGTSFNISARDQNVKVSVNTGTVEFLKTKENKVILQKGDEALYDSVKDTIKSAPIVDRNVFAYKTKVFEFNDTRLVEVVGILNKGYQSDIKLDGQNWSDYVLTTRFENENLSDALNIIAETLELQLKNRDRTYIFAKKTE